MMVQEAVVGRGATATQTNVSAVVGGGLLIAADATRRSLIISGTLASRVTISLNPIPVAGRGIVMPIGSGVVYISDVDHPGLARQAWYAISDTFTENMVTIACTSPAA